MPDDELLAAPDDGQTESLAQQTHVETDRGEGIVDDGGGGMTGSSDGAPFSAQGTTSATSSEVPSSPAGFDADGQPTQFSTGGPTVTGAFETVAGMAAEAVTGIPVVGPIIEGVLSMSSDTPPVKEPPDGGSPPPK